MESKIIGFSGKMQSGKDTCCNLLHSIALRNVLKLTDVAYINEDGKIVTEFVDEKGRFDHVLNIDSRHEDMMGWLFQNVWPFIRKFSFAEPLKEFCQYVLGLSEESVWGTNEQKNQPTHLLWENMPGLKENKSGPMTGREVMEYFGSQICRKMHPNIWANALVTKINTLKPKIATVCDVRFPNEVDAIKNAGGKVIRLTLETEEAKNNKHISNTALDSNVYDWTNFDVIIDNANMSMKESHDILLSLLIDWEILELQHIELYKEQPEVKQQNIVKKVNKAYFK